jgi:hypothetical protein
MKNLLNWYKSFFSIKNNYLFISFFATLLILKFFLNELDFSISDFSEIIPSSASFDNFDVAARVRIFYLSSALFCCCLILFAGIFYPLHKYLIKDYSLSDSWFFLSLTGIIILLFDLMGSANPFTLNLILLLFPALLIFQLSSKFILKTPYDNYLFLWLIFLSLSISVFSREMYFLGGGKQAGPFLEAFAFSFTGLTIIISILSTLANIPIKKLVLISLPLFLSPLISVVSDEAYLISNNYNLLLFSDEWFFISIFTLSYLMYGYVYYKFSNNSWTIAGSMRRFVIPFSLLGVLFFINYRSFIDQPTDLFELANPANGLMRMFVFHEWPFAEFLNSHLLSELFFPVIYTLFNGYSGGAEFLLYNFIHTSLMVFIAWFFISGIFKKPIMSFGIILLIPAIGLAFPGYHAWAFLSIFIIYHLVRHYSFKRLMFLIFFNIFLLFWKVEIGLSSSIATSVILLWYFIGHNKKKLLFDFIKAVLMVVGFVMILVAYFIFIEKTDFISHFLQAKAYFGASQEHGFSLLSFGKNKFYYFHYFIFPLSVLTLLLFMLFRTSFKPEKENLLLFLSLFFLSIYYMVNAQRGLVRHSLAQNTDGFISSFVFIILPLFIYFFLSKRRQSLILTLLLFIFIIQNFKVPELKGQKSLIENLGHSFIEKDLIIKFNKKINRVSGSENFELNVISGLRELMNNNFNDEATFIDFSNSPMLYYYTQREIPSYFCQYMQNTITPFLQEKNLELLGKMDVPIVVFSNIPETFFDQTDDIPNIIRYRLIRNFIYENYSPLGKINNHYIWAKTGLEINSRSLFIEDYSPPVSVQNLKLYPYLKAKEKNIYSDTTLIQQFAFGNSMIETYIKEKASRFNNYLLLIVENRSSVDKKIQIVYSTNGEIKAIYNIDIKSGIHNYILELSSVYSWLSNEYGRLDMTDKENNVEIKSGQVIRKSR